MCRVASTSSYKAEVLAGTRVLDLEDLNFNGPGLAAVFRW
jgi:hypothetical protein